MLHLQSQFYEIFHSLKEHLQGILDIYDSPSGAKTNTCIYSSTVIQISSNFLVYIVAKLKLWYIIEAKVIITLR